MGNGKRQKPKTLKFIDLFAGLGGFHVALHSLGHTCVFASEIDEELQDTYEKNFGIRPAGDIRKVAVTDIPPHDILCAGFPCQPFSKAGFQKGLKDTERGNLFFEILRILKYHQPSYILLENVPHIKKQDNGKIWKTIEADLRAAGYYVDSKELSPHHFGIPQIRLRTYIVAAKKGLTGFIWPIPNGKDANVKSVLDKHPVNEVNISVRAKKALLFWQEFLNLVPSDEPLPKPIWAMEFGATYPFEKTTPFASTVKELRRHKGAFGKQLRGEKKKEIYRRLPSHAQREDRKFPIWKVRMIKTNRVFYNKHLEILSAWTKKIQQLPSSYQKLEWNLNGGPRQITKYLVQLRASGVRVKELTTAPSLVAMTSTQVPIIPWENRYMTPKECSRLQSMDVLKHLPERTTKAYEALGNAVNVTVVTQVIKSLLIDRAQNA